MKFKHQIIATCLVGFLLGGASSFTRAEGLTQAHLPEVLCVQHKVILLWESLGIALQVQGIFCSSEEDIVLKEDTLFQTVANISTEVVK